MHIESNKDLSARNTLAVPCVATHYVEVSTEHDLRDALATAKTQSLPVVILGGGSNVILPEQLNAMVIAPMFSGFSAEQKGEDVYIRLGAGENWHASVCRCVALGYYGIENLALIPGSCGAAPIQNIGAYGVELSDVLVSVDVYDRQRECVEVLPLSACQLAYRDSVFKRAGKDRYVVMHIHLHLSSVPKCELSYPALTYYLAEEGVAEPTPKDVLQAVIAIRSSKLPDPVEVPNAGSFFKNPIVSQQVADALAKRYPSIPRYPVSPEQTKLPAAWLIEHAGWRGKGLDGVCTHDDHALVLINPEHRPAADVLAAAQAIQASVNAKFGIALEMEPQCVGWDN